MSIVPPRPAPSAHTPETSAPRPAGRPRRTAPVAASSSPPRARLEARELGIRAERAARDFLVERGFQILDVNLKVGRFEIDLLASEREVIVVVEVRARGPGSLVRPLDTIDARKRSRLRAAAGRLWRDRFAKDRRFDRLRFDCVAVTIDEAGGAHIEHVRAAF